MTFLIHHVGQMIIPAFFGLILWAYHIYYGVKLKVTEPDLNGIARYYDSVDQWENYPYVIMLALWSTWYIESWKRKQNTIKHIWAAEERLADISDASKKQQRGATWVIEEVSGKATETVLDRSEFRINMISFFQLTFWSIIAFVVWFICMKLQGTVLAMIPFVGAKDYAVFRTMWCVIIYSIAVIEFNGRFSKKAGDIVRAENHKYEEDHEAGMIQKQYTLGFVNSYLGMGVAAFFDRKLTGTAMLLSIVLALKQFVMNLRKCRAPRKAFPPKFEKHDAQMLVHFEKPGEGYEGLYTGPGGADKRYEHKEAER